VISIRVRSRIPQEELDLKVGKVLGDDAYNVLLTGPSRVFMPNGKLLCVYLPGAMTGHVSEEQYEVLHSLRKETTNNRGLASGSRGTQVGEQKRTYFMHVSSNILGAFEPAGTFKFCRLTAWTGRHLPQWELLQPVFTRVAEQMAAHVPDRYAAQMEEIGKTHPDWVVPGTPFTTITVNNTYPTGVHTDKGDLDKGFSTIFTLRRGSYTGGRFVFPEYRVAVDLQDGDLILMDAHQWHGNTAIICSCGERRTKFCEVCGAERISTVSYMRTAMTRCGSEKEEARRAVEYREKTKGVIR
jgi:2-oxoglutarate-Fe(II)-dependent dioxygenase family protein